MPVHQDAEAGAGLASIIAPKMQVHTLLCVDAVRTHTIDLLSDSISVSNLLRGNERQQLDSKWRGAGRSELLSLPSSEG